MSFTDAFRAAYGIIPDPLFVRMHDDGILSYGSPDEWHRAHQARAITNPPALLINPAIEWLADSLLLGWQTPDYWRKDLNFVAFAHEGGGDDWCWIPDFMGCPLPVIYAPHDLNRATVFAPDFESFLVRAFLESLIAFPDELDVREIEANCRVLEPYVRSEWNDLMIQIASRVPGVTDRNAKQFISPVELGALLREQFRYTHLDHAFTHMAQ
jgi:hypothetical protein